MNRKLFYWFKTTIVLIVVLVEASDRGVAQEEIENYINAKCARGALMAKIGKINNMLLLGRYPDRSVKEREELYAKKKALTNQMNQIKIPYIDLSKFASPPMFKNKEECLRYKSKLQQQKASLYNKFNELQTLDYKLRQAEDLEGAAINECEMTRVSMEIGLIDNKLSIYQCDCDKIDYNQNANTKTNSQNTSNLEAGFLAEIAKINADIVVINRLANEKHIVESFGSAQILCDKLRRYQGQQYFSSTLKKIRKNNPGFTFSIIPLAEQVTREYWIRMRNRANIAYRNALDAYKGCVYNEGIQQADLLEIPYAYIKLTNDIFSNLQSLYSKELLGTFQKIYKGYQNPSESLRPLMLMSEDVLAAGNDAYDWKSYVGVIGGVISGYDAFIKAQNMVTQHVVQGELIQANRQSARELISSGKNLLEQFDRYRAFIDSHSSSIDCLNDRIMRIEMDNKSIKGDKITIWGTGLYDWTGEEFINQIKKAGEDLKEEYIYCEDFIKLLQIAINQAKTDYNTIEEKVKSSGADQTQVTAQLSQNRENADWFEGESTRLAEYYAQFCDEEENTYPDDVVVVSTSVIPGAENKETEQNKIPEQEPVYAYEEDNKAGNDIQEKEVPDHSTSTGGNYSSAKVIKGDGWSAQKIENNPEAIQKDINRAISSGKTPAGLYISDGSEVVVYYIEGNPLGMTAWNLENYNDGTSLQTGINNKMEQGYFPMGISFTDNGNFYVLYILSKLSATSWQLVESELELNSVANDLQPHLQNHYVPVGITVYEDKYYTLLAQLPDAEMTNWTIEGYEDNNYTIKQSIDNKAKSGLVPFGYLKEGGIVNVLYVGF